MNRPVRRLQTRSRATSIAPTPLTATAINVDINDLLATITLEQGYANREADAIEVSYTIALPVDAVLLDVEIEIGGRRLRGQVEPSRQAEARYERAIAEGHSAFAIRMVDDHLLNIALGNLLPNESLTLKIVMAQWLTWNGDRVRLTLPTTIAPRYGECMLEPGDQPRVGSEVQHGLRLTGRVNGLLAGAELASPTHLLWARVSDGEMGFGIDAQNDRDVVIDLRDTETSLRAIGSISTDIEGSVAAMITFCAPTSSGRARPVVAEIIVDCSGSMAGVSIDQTRAAIKAIVEQLTTDDRVNVLRFGSTHKWLLSRPQPASPPVRRGLLLAVENLDADMGGTELFRALNAGLDDLARVSADSGGDRVIFIISDGEIWNLDNSEFLGRCALDRIRVFAVAVGAAAVEATFAPLTKATGGALERVLPSDVMAARIRRHFDRMRYGALENLLVRWPGATQWTRGPTTVYPGDGVVLSAGLITPTSEAEAEIEWCEPNGELRRLQVALNGNIDAVAPSIPARMLACQRIGETADARVATRMAVDYQLITPLSAITLVLERDANEASSELLPLRVVLHMPVAGADGRLTFQQSPPPTPARTPIRNHFRTQSAIAAPGYGETSEYDYLDIPAFQRRQADAGDDAPRTVAISPPIATPLMTRTGKAKENSKAKRVAKSAGENGHCSPERTIEPTQSLQGVPVDPFLRKVIELLSERLFARKELVALLADSALTLSALDLDVSAKILNWLDARAQALGLDLESGKFWRLLIDELCASELGAKLRRAVG